MNGNSLFELQMSDNILNITLICLLFIKSIHIYRELQLLVEKSEGTAKTNL